MADNVQAVVLPTTYQDFIHKSRYARWNESNQRRETWEETVSRYINFLQKHHEQIPQDNLDELKQLILKLEIMPSMRALMTAGVALEKDHVAGYNCSYLTINRVHAFDELMYILMCGSGVGFSVERQYVNNLPEISETMHPSDTVIVVRDSKLGWATSLRELLSLLWQGRLPKWDLNKIRPAGARLKTFGGRASGPQPLDDLFNFSVNLFSNATGRKLSSIECHDLVCKIADIVVVGGVRRSALISLSNLTDDRMRVAKSGQWWESNGQRRLANNSVCYTEKPDNHAFMSEWLALYDSKSGERGIFNRQASINQVKKNGRRDHKFDFGTNPCSEIILRDRQFCNLTEVVVRSEDSLDDLIAKVKMTTRLGTIQSSFTNFRYLSRKWKENTEAEALLGVSLTGIMDHPVLGGSVETFECGTKLPEALSKMRDAAVEENLIWSKMVGVNQSTAITCVKPSGTVGQLVDASAGIHTRYSKYYIRTVRNDVKDPLTQLMIQQGIPNEPAFGSEHSTVVFSFPVKAPENCLTRNDLSAIDQLVLWETYQTHWCEHKPSITVYVREHEWMEVGAWVYNNFDNISGISFLPYDNGTYKQAPYQEISEEEYNKLSDNFPTIDWDALKSIELEDMTTSSQTLACVAGSCEL